MAAHNKNPFHQWIRLEQPRLGTKVVYATDDFFADKSRLIDPAEPVFIADKFDDNGKWMDGWESRRKRVTGHDHCVIRLGVRGTIRGLDIDTRHFTGNFPPEASVEACISADENPGDAADWQEIQPRLTLHGDAHHYLAVEIEQSQPTQGMEQQQQPFWLKRFSAKASRMLLQDLTRFTSSVVSTKQ